MTTQPSPLHIEFLALRSTLERLLKEQRDLEWLCKYVPRLASAAANVRRIEAALTSTHITIDAIAIRQALEELTAEIAIEE